MKYLLLSLLFPALCFAQEPVIKVSLTVVPGANALSRKEAREAFRHTKLIYSHDVGVNLVLVSTVVKRAPQAVSLLATTYENSTPQLLYWSKRFKRAALARGVINLAVLPPLPIDGKSYVSGRAGGFCDLHTGFAYVTAMSRRDNGLSGIKYTSYVLAHELGHILGALHIDTQTIMNPYPFPYLDQYGDIPFDIESTEAIRECLASWAKKR